MPNIRHALLIGSSIDKVYNAITTDEGLSAWWTPASKATARINSISRFPFGATYFKEMKITELKPFKLVKWNCVSGANEWIGTSISFKLVEGDNSTLQQSYPEMQGQIEQQASDKNTLLQFHHDDWNDYTLMFAECNYTWGQFLRSLKLFCETAKGRPWPNTAGERTTSGLQYSGATNRFSAFYLLLGFRSDRRIMPGISFNIDFVTLISTSYRRTISKYRHIARPNSLVAIKTYS